MATIGSITAEQIKRLTEERDEAIMLLRRMTGDVFTWTPDRYLKDIKHSTGVGYNLSRAFLSRIDAAKDGSK